MTKLSLARQVIMKRETPIVYAIGKGIFKEYNVEVSLEIDADYNGNLRLQTTIKMKEPSMIIPYITSQRHYGLFSEKKTVKEFIDSCNTFNTKNTIYSICPEDIRLLLSKYGFKTE